jgi:predicted O-linked N-acetylglucosamine transferase (SPINDLY family)
LVFARRPAPVQISWAAYVGTTGLRTMDYLLADRFHVRSGEEANYTERILRMPHDYICFEAPAESPEVAPLPAAAAGYVTFGCFNNALKLSPGILEAWASILERVPQSRLLLKNRSLGVPELRERLWAHFARHSIAPERIVLEGEAAHRELLGAYGRVDIALDTQPYSGGLTTCEALWMGVPVITFPGPTFAGRHSTSHLQNAGFPEFVAENRDGYIESAVQWAQRLGELSILRAGMRERARQSALCDAPRFGQDLMALLHQTLVRAP